ncbi:alanine and proline-rich secreted protein Apa [Pendulispora rubella]|uniref:Alanine and proline-rich secreted protein Apa n=1 Tax=Pendulispora rubella TaxID=2741070 RepID=A0ABZ2KT92_9BACT
MQHRKLRWAQSIGLVMVSFSIGCGVLFPYPSSQSNAPPPSSSAPTASATALPPPAARHDTPPPADKAKPEYSKPEFEHSVEEREAFIAENTEGYVKEGAAVTRKLDGFTTSHHKLRRGRCYTMVVRLESGASFSPHAKKGLSFISREGRTASDGGPGVHGPGGVGSLGCPQKNVESEFDLKATWGSADDATHIHDLGTGPITMQLMSKPISEKELRDQQGDVDKQRASSCEYQYKSCLHGEHDPGRMTCAEEYERCMQRIHSAR